MSKTWGQNSEEGSDTPCETLAGKVGRPVSSGVKKVVCVGCVGVWWHNNDNVPPRP